MTNGELLTHARTLGDRFFGHPEQYVDSFRAGQAWVLEHFGQNGLYAAYLVGGVLAIYIISKIIKITFAAVKYLLVPGVGLALIGSFVSPYPFMFLLPITLTGCSLLLLFKG